MLPMEAATAGTAWSGYPSTIFGRRLGIVSPKGSSSCFMLGTRRVNHHILSGSRLLRKPVSVSKSLCELQHDFRDSNPNRFLKRRNILLLVGLDFRSAPPDALEKLAISDSELPCAVAELFDTTSIKEAAILSTSDQFEIYMVGKSEHIGIQEIFEWMEKKSGIPASELRKWCYIDHENDAARHLFEVASGLHSLVLGDGKILEQIKVVVTSLKGAKTFGMIVGKLFQLAISVGRLVRSQIDLSCGRVSVGSAAVDLALSKLPGSASDAKVLIVGAGRMGQIVLKNSVAKGFNSITMANRTSERICALRDGVKGVELIYKPLEDLVSCIREADVIFTCVTSGHPLILEEHMHGLKSLDLKSIGLKLFFDVSIPRSIDAGISKFTFVRLFDIRDIEEMVQGNKHNPLWKSIQAQPYIDQQVSKLESWRNKLEIVDFLIWIEAHLGTIQAIAVGDLLRQMGDDDVPLDVSRALEKFGWDMWKSFFNVMVAQMFGRL